MRTLSFILFSGLFCLLLLAFRPEETTRVAARQTLSEYGFFAGKLADQMPAEGVVPYRLNTPLFSDYAEKLRFVKLPAGQTVPYNATEVLNFPVGTTLIKTFYFPNDFRDASKGRRLMETRLLIHETAGWKAFEYVWNDEQTEAVLEVAGDRKPVTYVDADGRSRQQEYIIPNLNQCKSCHNRAEVLMPIGPSARQLNGDLAYSGGAENQLIHWQKAGWLTDMPTLTDVPRAPVWNDPQTGSLDDRARIWLDINCAHCHRPDGPASTSGLNLSIHEHNPTAWGIMKTPVAAGRGSGGRGYDIVPGRPDESILLYRMESTDPGVMMPEVSRKVTHKEGVALVREWIKSLPNATSNAH
ncbi:SO2930 family diheme c-type cytochrome [Spirosoma arcticum]